VRPADEDFAVIRIRYRDFSAHADEVTWLYGRAERSATGTVVYLQPGLTPGQRRAAIRRLRQEGARGLGPPLPPAALLLAMAVDGVRATFGTMGAVIRLHPAAALLPGACAVVLAAFFVLATATGPGGPSGRGPGSRSSPQAPVAAGAAGPVLRPRAIVIVPAVSRTPAWYVRPRGPAASGPRAAGGVQSAADLWSAAPLLEAAHRPVDRP
jgi:hypothetical protein